MYHSQRNRLRTALGHLYYEALAQDHRSDPFSPKQVPGNTMLSSQVLSPGSPSQNAQLDHMPQKVCSVHCMLLVLHVHGYLYCWNLFKLSWSWACNAERVCCNHKVAGLIPVFLLEEKRNLYLAISWFCLFQGCFFCQGMWSQQQW